MRKVFNKNIIKRGKNIETIIGEIKQNIEPVTENAIIKLKNNPDKENILKAFGLITKVYIELNLHAIWCNRTVLSLQVLIYVVAP